ncbi:MAG: hypothetical protein QNJ36_13570, partial [Calothrix sp. MO_167.B42]|nr:hypothetical protein [Calothrix sp. MO_167.B42]
MNTNKHIKNQISRNGVSQEYLFVRDGVSQHDRLLTELEPDYVTVDERDLSDLLTFVQEYATKLNYYDDYDDSDNVNGDWLPFFNADVEQMVAYIHNPESFADDESTLKQLSQPHLVLLFTFLQLLSYPQQQFQALTQRYLDFYYKEVLKLTTKQETPDKINVIFELAQGEEAHLIKQGTLLNAGQDSQGINLNYATDEDIIVNQAQIASVKTLFVGYISLEDIHLQDNKSDQSFENMLRWAVGSPNQGDQLPNFNNDSVDIDYLKKNIYEQFGKNGINKKNYIKNQLFFENVGDFLYCMRMHYKEINDKNPTESEWNKVYQIIEAAYNKKNINTQNFLPIDQTEIQNIYASSIVDTEEEQATIPEYFNTFGNIIETPQNSLGFAVASPLFLLQEGVRTITLTFICEPETLNQDTLQEILDSENEVFEIYLSSGTQWIQLQSFTPSIANEQEPYGL